MKCLAKRNGFYNGRRVRPGQMFQAEECPSWATECIANEQTGVVETTSIREALLKLNKRIDEQWTKSGTPKVDVVSELCGYKVTKKEIDDTWPGFHRDMISPGEKNQDGSIAGA